MTPAYQLQIDRAQAALEAARESLMAEFASYPTPIAGCDAQYTRLLADRSRIAAALTALAAEPFVPTPRTLTPGAGVESR